jgi:hypothetical protein
MKFLMLILLMLMLFAMTGCSVIEGIFGSEYILVDFYYDQLEADVLYTLNEYKSQSNTDKIVDFELYKTSLLNHVKAARNETKAIIPKAKDFWYDDLALVATQLKSLMDEDRQEIEKSMNEQISDIITLKSTELNRDLLSSIWYFIRNHWFISLLIFCAVSTVFQKIGRFIGKIGTHRS